MSFPCAAVLLGMLYAEEKERLDFIYTIYHWWQAIAIFIVYLWSGLPMRVNDSFRGNVKRLNLNHFYNLFFFPFTSFCLQAKLSILLATLLLSCYCYCVMERRMAKKVQHRLPRIPRPRHKVSSHNFADSLMHLFTINLFSSN